LFNIQNKKMLLNYYAHSPAV